MFYFFFESRNNKKKDPVVIWLTGGPGCSSDVALFYENGPFKIANNLSLIWNKFGWDQVCVYITNKFLSSSCLLFACYSHINYKLINFY